MSRGQWVKNRDRRLIELAQELSGEPPEVVERVCYAFSLAMQLRMLETGGTTTIPGIGDLNVNIKEMWSGLTEKKEPMVKATILPTERFKEEFKRLARNNPTLTAEELTRDFRNKLTVLVMSQS